MTNVLLITTDQQRADSIGAYGNPVCQTPNLDRLAAQGTRFTGCRTQHPFCQPARATILTGQYPSTHGVTFNGIDLPDDATDQSVATAFGRAGYRTALIGKAHFASIYPHYPTGKLESVEGSMRMPDDWTGPYFGFDYVQMVLFGHNMRIAPLMGRWGWWMGPAPIGLHYGRSLYRNGPERGDELLRLSAPEAAGGVWDHTQTWRSVFPEEEHPTTWIADRTIDWLGERAERDEPFFGWVSFTDPHHPMDPPERWFDMYSAADVTEVLPDRKAETFAGKPPLHEMWSRGARDSLFDFGNPGGAHYSDAELAGMIAAYYGMVSQIDHNIGRIMTELDEQGLADDTVVIMTTDHGELLGDHQMIFKGPLHYEGLLKVALIAKGPGFEAGAVVDDPVGTIDLAPTMLRAAGVGTPDHLEGRPLLDGPREWVLTEDDFDVLVEVPLRTITTSRHKLTMQAGAPGNGELYDLYDDPGELTNLWDEPGSKAIKDDLLALLDEVSPDLARELPRVGTIG
jgi:arylsulfatase A-like enzyme